MKGHKCFQLADAASRFVAVDCANGYSLCCFDVKLRHAQKMGTELTLALFSAINF